MQRCPTCNAKYDGKQFCRRCKTNLEKLINIEKQADIHRTHAVEAFVKKDVEQMLFHAKRACSLRQTPVTEKLLACAAVLNHQFDLALHLWKRCCRQKHKRSLCSDQDRG